MYVKNVIIIQDYMRKRLSEKFGTEAVYEKYKEQTVSFDEYFNGNNVYQIKFNDRRTDYDSSRQSLCFLDEKVANEIVDDMKIYNDEIQAIYEELLRSIIDNDYIVNPDGDSNKQRDYEKKLCEKFNIPYGDFDWRVLSGYITKDCLGYSNIYFEKRNKAEEESNYNESTEEQGPYGGAFKDEADFWRYKEGRNFC